MIRSIFGLLLAALLFGAATHKAPTGTASTYRVLIILQENGGELQIFDEMNKNDKAKVTAFVDALAETFMSVKSGLQSFGRYDKVIDLSNTNCTRAKLLDALINESVTGREIDLLVLGHGNRDVLVLHGGNQLTASSVRSLLSDARARKGNSFNFKLRLVYMCNCFGSTMNDDWLHIGAKTSVGSRCLNTIPEPMITFFINDFVNNGKSVSQAANDSWAGAKLAWAVPGAAIGYGNAGCTVIPNDCPGFNCYDQSRPIVAGDGNIKFDGKRLAVGESKSVLVQANKTYNFYEIQVRNGEQYKFEVTSSGSWKNGGTSANADGYNKGMFDSPRQGGYKMMALCGELFRKYDDISSYTGKHFLVGKGPATKTMAADGFLMLYANDNLAFYGDNSGSMSVRVTRVK